MSHLVILAAVLGMVSGPDASQQRRVSRTATFAVQVSDPAGTPVGGVMVTIEGGATRSARTEGGRIAFEDLPLGVYRLRFERDGFLTLEREVIAKAGAPIDVKVTLTPAPAPAPPPPPAEPGPEPTATSGYDAQPVMLDVPEVIEKEFIGRGAGKTTPLACAEGGSATLIQVREPVATHAHADADEFVYVVAGEGSAAISGREERLRAGVFLLVPRGVTHSLKATGRNPLMVLSTLAGEPCGAR